MTDLSNNQKQRAANATQLQAVSSTIQPVTQSVRGMRSAKFESKTIHPQTARLSTGKSELLSKDLPDAHKIDSDVRFE